MAEGVSRGGVERGPPAASRGAALLRRSAPAADNEIGRPPRGIAQAIAARRGGGRPLSARERAFYEPRLEADLGGVRLHLDAPAAEMAEELRAEAFTSGQDVFFGPGRSPGGGGTGDRLLAHELVHTVQQAAAPAVPGVQRQTLFGPGTGAPSNWSTKVSGATTSAKKAALIQQATGVTTVDVTASTSADVNVDKTKLVPYGASSQKINYDHGLNSKKSMVRRGRKSRPLTRNAGYTITSTKNYVVLGPKSLKGGDFFLTRRILSHEFDHIRQAKAGSKLKHNESELDAWTKSFIRDFHRSYVLERVGKDCRIRSYPSWNPLLEYYVRRDVRAAARDLAIKRLKNYYNATIKPHKAHAMVFRSWVRRRIKTAGPKFDDLPVRLNSELGLKAGPTDTLPARVPCSTLAGLTYPKAPTVAKP